MDKAAYRDKRKLSVSFVPFFIALQLRQVEADYAVNSTGSTSLGAEKQVRLYVYVAIGQKDQVLPICLIIN
jgi:hypothetical protein